MKIRKITATALFTLLSGPVLAGAVTTNSPNFVGADNSLGAYESIIVAASISNDSYSGDPAYVSAQAMAGSWFTFFLEEQAGVTITAESYPFASFSPGMTVWASGSNEFDGGSATGFIEASAVTGHSTPDSFNATGQIGSDGTLWMSDGFGGNLQETLGYAVSGPSVMTSTAWGESILHGAHDVSITDTYETGVTGSVTSGMAQLTFSNMQPGWYATFIGGTNPGSPGGYLKLTVSAVPEMETWAMMIIGMCLLGWRMKKQQEEMSGHSA